MNTLNLKETTYTPRVTLNKGAGIFELSGRSLPEDSDEFYEPVVAWMKQYIQSPNPATLFSINLKYFNSSSAKIIYSLLHSLKTLSGIHVEWCYHHDDEDILEAGQEFAEELEMSFTFKEV